MDTVEANVPYIKDDFAIGDRVCYTNSKMEQSFGRVSSIHDNHVRVRMDDGKEVIARFAVFDRFHGWRWDKVLDLSTLSVGDRVSSKRERTERIYATVKELVPGNRIILRVEMENSAGKYYVDKHYEDTGEGLEKWLTRWQLEG